MIKKSKGQYKNIASQITFNCEAFRSSAPSAAARRLRTFTLFVLAERPLLFDHWDAITSEPCNLEPTQEVPLARVLSAGLAFRDHVCHSQPLIEVRAHPSDLGHRFDALDLPDLIFFTAICFDAACLDPFASFVTFDGCDDTLSTVRFLFVFAALLPKQGNYIIKHKE